MVIDANFSVGGTCGGGEGGRHSSVVVLLRDLFGQVEEGFVGVVDGLLCFGGMPLPPRSRHELLGEALLVQCVHPDVMVHHAGAAFQNLRGHPLEVAGV